MNPKNQQVLILGAGAIAKDIADLVSEEDTYQVAGFIVDQPPFVRGSQITGKPIYWIDEVEDFSRECLVICGLAKMKKISLINHFKEMGFQFASFIHPSCRVSPSVQMGEGVIINSGVHIAIDAHIDEFIYINRGSLIGHDTSIGAYSVISPGANIAGSVTIGTGCYIGMGAIITERVVIGKNCFVGAGSLVSQDLPDRVKVLGMPARIIEQNIQDF